MHARLHTGLLLALACTGAHPVLAQNGDEGIFLYGALLTGLNDYDPGEPLNFADVPKGGVVSVSGGLEIGLGYYLNKTFGFSASVAVLPEFDLITKERHRFRGVSIYFTASLHLRYEIWDSTWAYARLGFHRTEREYNEVGSITFDTKDWKFIIPDPVYYSVSASGPLASIGLIRGIFLDQLSVTASFTMRAGSTLIADQEWEFGSSFALGLSWEF